MLDSLAAALLVAEGGALAALLKVLPPRPLDEVAQAAIAALVAVVEADTTRRLQVGGTRRMGCIRSAEWVPAGRTSRRIAPTTPEGRLLP